jgi:hypothetical protein
MTQILLFVANLAGAGQLVPLGRASFGFHLWHMFFL